MNWRPLIMYPAALSLMLGGATIVQAAKSGTGDSGPPSEPTNVAEAIWMTGKVHKVTLYELKETLVAYDYDDNVWVETLVPVAEPDDLYFLTVTEDQTANGYTFKAGEEWLLDFGPEWYAADPCLIDSYICPDGGLIKVGPYILGDFTCEADGSVLVNSNDPNPDNKVYITEEEQVPIIGTPIPLMSRTSRNALPDKEDVYAFGRYGGSELVWIWDPDEDGIFERYPKAGSNILWEMDFGDGQQWWRGEAPPQSNTSELSCSTTL